MQPADASTQSIVDVTEKDLPLHCPNPAMPLWSSHPRVFLDVAATGEAKVADMPPAAPATNKVLRSALVRWNICAIMDPNAPPVIMMGPSAPNGPPDPIEIAEESGLSNATLGSTRLPFIKIDSIASGIPCPRIRSEP